MTYLYFYIEPNIKFSPHNAESEPISSASAVSQASLGKAECTCRRVIERCSSTAERNPQTTTYRC